MTKEKIVDWSKWNIMHGKVGGFLPIWYVFEPSAGCFEHPYGAYASWREAMDYVIKRAYL